MIFIFSICVSCRERYSTTQSHKLVRGDLAIILNCDFVLRAALSYAYVPATDDVPAHFTHSDGVCRLDKDNTAVGFNVFLAPGVSEADYGTCDVNSPARFVVFCVFVTSVLIALEEH